MIQFRFKNLAALIAVSSFSQSQVCAQSNVNRGLWVGEVTLSAVNEVAVPLNANNVPVAPNPSVPTKTFDSANLRLILHVDGSGKVNLLKDVAVLSRTGGAVTSENEMALVTDPTLYGAFPPQAAMRIASAVFDFGDSKATDAVNKIVDAASIAARNSIQAGRTDTQATLDAKAAAELIVGQSDVVEHFSDFLAGPGKKSNVVDIADGAPAGAAATMRTHANALLSGSFYADSRGVEMVNAIEAAIAQESTIPGKVTVAQNTAASFADISNNYERYLAGQIFGGMIDSAAQSVATAAAALPLKLITKFEGTNAASPVTITSMGHGLGAQEEIAILDSATGAYNGLHVATRIDANQFTIPVPFIGGKPITDFQPLSQVSPLFVTAPGHGLTSGAKITIYEAGEASYNESFVATVVDANTFTIPTAFASNPAQKGKWSSRSGLIVGYEANPSGSAGVKISAPNHGLSNGEEIMISGSAKASYNGVKIISRIDNDSFAIDQAFDGNPEVKGNWSIRKNVSGYAPPSVLSTKVVSAAHGLRTGDRISITGSGFAAYNAGHVVEVLSPDVFVLPVDWDPVDGNPATKGEWAPVLAGQWRRVSAIRSAVATNTIVNSAKEEALRIQVVAYSDSRSMDAVNTVLEAIIAQAAVAPVPVIPQIAIDAEAAGREALFAKVKRYAQPSSRPTSDYQSFVDSAAYKGAPAIAAAAAVQAARFEKNNSILSNDASILDKARQAAITSLNSVYGAAARAIRADLPLVGEFGPGKSDLRGTLILPANHPTNPFRHRRHPDHTVGFDITRKIDLDFDGEDGESLAPGTFGVQRITGTYEEEIFGLHKPLGQNQNIGLKVKGTFQLNRVSTIDALNGR